MGHILGRLIAVAAIASPAAAQQVAPLPPAPAVRFAPPLDRTLRYETVQSRPVGGATARFTMVQEHRFTRAPSGGYILETTLVDYRADAPAAMRPMFEAGMAPLKGVTLRSSVTPDGQHITPIDAAASWAKVVAGMRTMLTTIDADPAVPEPTVAGVRGYLAALERFTDAQRDAQLTEREAILLAIVGWTHPIGSRQPYRTSGELPGFGTVAVIGTQRLNRLDPVQAHLVREARTDARSLADMAASIGPAAQAISGAEISETNHIVVERATGLLIAQRSSKTTKFTIGGQSISDTAEESTRRIP